MNKTKLSVVKRRVLAAKIIALIIASLAVLFGLFLATVSIVRDYVDASRVFLQFENAFVTAFGNVSLWRYWGLLFVIGGVIILCITIYASSKKTDSDEKLQKTKANRTALNLDALAKKEEQAQ